MEHTKKSHRQGVLKDWFLFRHTPVNVRGCASEYVYIYTHTE